MKKILITTLIIATLTMLLIPMHVAAVDLGINPDNYKVGAAEIGSKANNVVSAVLGIIQMIGTTASVVVLMIIGIKYMLGSPEDRFEYKQSLKLYLLGTFLLFTLTWLPQLIYTFVTGILN